MKHQQKIRYQKVYLALIFLIQLILLLILLFFIVSIMLSDRVDITEKNIIKNYSIRGKIISSEGKVLSYSQKIFKSEINTKSIDPQKKDLFISLYSLYTSTDEDLIKEKFFKKNNKKVRGYLILSDNLNSNDAKNLRNLNSKMKKLNIFKPINPKKSYLVQGLDILDSHEDRIFPKNNTLSPILGFTNSKYKNNKKKYKVIDGIKGLEAHYNFLLSNSKDYQESGHFNIKKVLVRDKQNSSIEYNGDNIHLNINLEVQKEIEKILDKHKKTLKAEEIIHCVMESSTGKILSIVTSNRFNPNKILQTDVDAGILDIHAIEYLYEPASVIKPFTLAIALDNNKTSIKEKIDIFNTKFRVNDNFLVKEDKYFESVNLRDILTYSSNIGTVKIAFRLTGQEFYDGLYKFGLSQKTGIDLNNENPGKIRSAKKLKNKIYKGTTSYGYGMYVNFMQLIKGYSAFNNNGVAVIPKILDYISDFKESKVKSLKFKEGLKSCTPATAKKIHKMLVNVVEVGTGANAQYDGLEVGGKTGTARISINGEYVSQYHSSFFGFVNDKFGNKYTIGTLVIKPKTRFYSSATTTPIIAEVIEVLVKKNFLYPDKILQKSDYAKRIRKRRIRNKKLKKKK